MAVKCTVIIQKEEKWYVATDVSTNVTSQGLTMEESIENLKEALCLYYENNAPQTPFSDVYITTIEVAI